jgi:hypothetical protein
MQVFTAPPGGSEQPAIAPAPAPVVRTQSAAAPVLARAPQESTVTASAPSWQTTLPPIEQTISRMPFVPAQTGKSYESMVDELRRDLLRQRERMGDLLGDLPWA